MSTSECRIHCLRRAGFLLAAARKAKRANLGDLQSKR